MDLKNILESAGYENLQVSMMPSSENTTDFSISRDARDGIENQINQLDF